MKSSPFNRLIVVAALFFLGLATSNCFRPDGAGKETSAPYMNKLADYIEMEKELGFSGVIAIRNGSQEAYYHAAGFSDKEQAIRNQATTVFDIGSLTKQFTGAALLQLEQEGLIKVTDSLHRFFSDIPQDKSTITIHQLLVHSSGFPRRLGSDFEKLTKNKFIERAFHLPLDFTPGEKYSHSHVGYSLLGIIIENVSGMTYEEFLKDRFFDPLEMDQTGYVLPSWNMRDIAKGYRKCTNWGRPMDLNWGPEGPYWNLKANGGLLSHAVDLMKWHDALETNRIFSEEVMKRYLTPFIKEGRDASSYYSYGWMITKSLRGTAVYAHEGGNGKFLSDWINYPQEKVSVLVLSNEWIPGYWNIASQVARILFYPHHEPEVQLKQLDCFTDFPDSKPGRIARQLIGFLTSENNLDPFALADSVFGSYVNKKYPKERIVGTINACKDDCGPAELKEITLFNHDFMEIELTRVRDQQRIQVQISFDKEDSYLIKKLRYNSDN